MIVGRWFQVLFHSAHCGSFHLSLTVLVHYRSKSSIQGWRVVSPASARISRVLAYSGYCYLEITFHIRGYHPVSLIFPNYSTRLFQWILQSSTPNASIRFALFPVRSPLLRESLLISFPLGTEMFHFPRFAPFKVTSQCQLGCPIRKSTDQSFLTAPRSLSQSNTSFIASLCQDIHHLPLKAYFHIRPYKVSYCF